MIFTGFAARLSTVLTRRVPRLKSYSALKTVVRQCSASAGSASSRVCSQKQLVNNMYIAEERGSPYSPDYRVFFKDEQGPISPLHDIPCWVDKEKGIVNMIVEIPRWSNAKMEICLSEPLNPIKQDVKKGTLRFVHNVFPHHGYIWNYGAIPQTWENPSHIDASTQARGDNDPIDIIEIGSRVANRGEVRRVKVLGALALLDEGETDWKLVAIDEQDSLAANLNDINDVEQHCPGLLAATAEWFRIYKVPAGKPVNVLGLEGRFQDASFARDLVRETHEFWTQLHAMSNPPHDINLMNVTIPNSSAKVEREKAASVLVSAPHRSLPQLIPSSVDAVHYVSSNL